MTNTLDVSKKQMKGIAIANQHAKLFYYNLPFSSPLNFNGQALIAREGLILQLQNNSGQLSFGEIAPLPGFSRENLQQATTQIISLLNGGIENLQQSDAYYPSVQFALACALESIPLTTTISPLDTIPLLQGNNADVIKQYLTLNRPDLIKLKVARQPLPDDISLFTQLITSNPALKVRCDANRSWSVAQCSRFLEQIDIQQLDYIEEPTSSYQDNLTLAEKYQINLALDETLIDIDFKALPDSCVKALILKPTLLGSLERLQSFIDIAQKRQLQVHISSSFESIIGLQQLRYLATTYQKKCALSLGIDTLKYFQSGLLIDPKNIKTDLQKLECLWSSN